MTSGRGGLMRIVKRLGVRAAGLILDADREVDEPFRRRRACDAARADALREQTSARRDLAGDEAELPRLLRRSASGRGEEPRAQRPDVPVRSVRARSRTIGLRIMTWMPRKRTGPAYRRYLRLAAGACHHGTLGRPRPVRSRPSSSRGYTPLRCIPSRCGVIPLGRTHPPHPPCRAPSSSSDSQSNPKVCPTSV